MTEKNPLEMYDTPAEALYYQTMNGCGCGNGNEIAEKAWEIFTAIATNQENKHELIYTDLYHETITQWFDSLDLIEHGGSVGGSWLSEKGKSLYKELITYYHEPTRKIQ